LKNFERGITALFKVPKAEIVRSKEEVEVRFFFGAKPKRAGAFLAGNLRKLRFLPRGETQFHRLSG